MSYYHYYSVFRLRGKGLKDTEMRGRGGKSASTHCELSNTQTHTHRQFSSRRTVSLCTLHNSTDIKLYTGLRESQLERKTVGERTGEKDSGEGRKTVGEREGRG